MAVNADAELCVENGNVEDVELFAGLTESATIVVATLGEDNEGKDDELLVSMKVSDLVAEYVELRSSNGEVKLSGAALDGAKAIRDDIVVALKTLNATILAADVAAIAQPKMK